MAGSIYRALTRGAGSIKRIKDNIVSKYLGDGLSDLYSEEEAKNLGLDTKTKKDTSKDSGYDKNLGQPKQDLNKQPVPEYQPPTSAGKDSNFYKSEQEQDSQEFGNLVNPITTPTTETQPPVSSGVDEYQTGLKSKNDEIKKNNEAFIKKYLAYMTKAGKFGELGQKFQGDATNMMQYKIKKPETAPEYDTKNMQTDANGYAFEMKWNGKQFVKVPVTGADGKPILMKDVASEKEDKQWERDYKERQLQHKIDYDNTILEIKQLQEDRKNNKTGNSSNGNKSGNNNGTTTTGDGYNDKTKVVVDKNGREVKLEFREEPILDNVTGLPTGKTTKKWYIAGTNQPAGDLQTGYSNLNSKNPRVVQSQIDKYRQKDMDVQTKGERKKIKDKVTGDIDKILSKLSPEARDAWILQHGELLEKLK